MKLRMQSNSVRLRLTMSEVVQFCDLGRVEESVRFGVEPEQQLIYALEASSEIEEVRASCESGRILVCVPLRQAEQWARSDQVGIEVKQMLDAGKSLRILIEKDFACLNDRDGENEADAYPHPASGKRC